MNKGDLIFVVSTIGLGLGLGASLAKTYGIVGFIGGLLAAVISMSALLGAICILAPKPRPRGRSRRNKSEDSSRDQ